MHDWREHKEITKARQVENKIKKQQYEYLEKENKRQNGMRAFKNWLKNNLLEQRQQQLEKQREKYAKTLEDEDLKKKKEN